MVPGSRLPRAARREQILGAAATAFLGGGFDGTSMEAVAEAAGVTRLIVYRIFGTKEDLYRAVLGSVVERLAEVFSDESAYERPGGMAALLLGVARERPDAFRLLWRRALHEPTFAAEVAAFRESAAEFAERVLSPLLADDEFRHWMAGSVLAYLYDGICAWLDDGDPQRDGAFVIHLAAGSRAMVQAWRAPSDTSTGATGS